MSVNPLDLQTNFMNINNISKKEVLSREQEVLKQEKISDNIKKNMDKDLEDVPITKKNESVELISDYKENNKKNSKREIKKDIIENEENDEQEKKNDKESNEIDLEKGIGKNINIVG